MKIVITILLSISLSSYATYTWTKCPNILVANKYTKDIKCSKVRVISFRKMNNPTLEAESTDGRKIKFTADNIDGGMTIKDITDAAKVIQSLSTTGEKQ